MGLAVFGRVDVGEAGSSGEGLARLRDKSVQHNVK